MDTQADWTNQYSKRDSLALLESYLEPARIVEFLRNFHSLLPWIVAQRRLGRYGNQPVQSIVQGYIKKCDDIIVPNNDFFGINQEISRLRLRFTELGIFLSDLENPIQLPESVEIQNHLDRLYINAEGGDIERIVSLFQLLAEGLSGAHSQGEVIRKWLWYRMAIDIKMIPYHGHGLLEYSGFNFPRVLASVFDTYSIGWNDLLISRSDTTQEQYELFLEYSARISQILGPLSTPIKRSPASGVKTRKGNITLQSRSWRRT